MYDSYAMANYQTKTSTGDEPDESIQEYKEHARNVEQLETLLREIDGLADSMKSSYDQDSKVGRVTLFLEFYDDD